jgi:microcystin-dependent protein
MANYEATKYNFSGASLTDVEGVNTGIIVPWGDSTPPSGFLECDGSAVSRSTYSALFAVIGTTYGSGDGSTTFDLPDLQDKVVQGRGPTYSLAQNVGSSTVTITGNISGSLDSTAIPVNLIGPHSHPRGIGGGFGTEPEGALNPPATPANSGNAGAGGSHNHNLSLTFTGDSISTEQADFVLMYVIKT